MDSEYAKELKVAISAVQSAAKLSTRILQQSQQVPKGGDGGDANAHDLGVVSKDDLSPVTIADFALQALLACTIHHHFPTDRFVGEESADALRQNPRLLERVWGALQEQASGDAAHSDDDDDDDEAKAAAIRYPASPEEMCQVIDWCGTGHPGQGGRIWIFDPIDGTANFVQGLVYAINAALLVDGRQALAVVGCPNMSSDVAYPAGDASLDPAGDGCLLLAARGHGTWVRKLHGGRPGDASLCTRVVLPPAPSGGPDPKQQQQQLRSVSAHNSSGLGAVHEEVARRLSVEWPGSILLPWVLRWVLLALGVGHVTWWVYKERARLAKVWDHAGAMLLFEEVGGKITDIDGRPVDLTVNRKMTGNYGFVAAPAAVHDLVLATVQAVVREHNPELLEQKA